MNFLPQLAQPLSSDLLVKYAEDPGWEFQQKLDGVRMGVVIDNGNIELWGRNGSAVTNVTPAIINAFSAFPGTWIFDGEYMRDTTKDFWVFDMPMALSRVDFKTEYQLRRKALEAVMTQITEPSIRLLPSYTTTEDKLRLIQECLAKNAEGIMVKKATAPYVQGKRTLQTMKAKFWESADCIVTEVGREGKRSIAISVYTPEGKLLPPPGIGSCKVTDAMLDTLAEGDVVEVKYLYVGVGNRLYQPSFLRLRTDKAPEECTMDQLKHVNKSVLEI